MIEVVSNYVIFLRELKDYIAKSPYKTSFIYETLKMNKVSFYRKLRTQSFTPIEVLNISKILFPAEAILLELDKSNKDKEVGRIIAHSEAMSLLRKKHL